MFYKKLILGTLFIIIGGVLYGQPQKGKLVITGSTSLSGRFFEDVYWVGTTQLGKSNTVNYSFQPSIGTFISYFVRLGLFAQYTYDYESTGDDYSKKRDLCFGPYVRTYFSDSKVAPFINVRAGYSSFGIAQRVDFESSELKLNGGMYGLGAGLEIFIKRRFSTEFIVEYSATHVSKRISSSNLYGISSNEKLKFKHKGISFNVGINVFIN